MPRPNRPAALVGVSERDFGRLEERVEALRAEIQRMQAEQLSNEAAQRAWLLTLLPTSVLMADILIRFLPT